MCKKSRPLPPHTPKEDPQGMAGDEDDNVCDDGETDADDDAGH